MLPWVRLPYAIIQWSFWAAFKGALFLIGLPAVAFSLAGDGRNHTPRMWRLWADIYLKEVQPGTWIPHIQVDGNERNISGWSIWQRYWWFAIRNPVTGLGKIFAVPIRWEEYGGIDESKPGYQWRYRHTTWADSFRIAWGRPRLNKGKKEFYIGWKIGSTSPYKFTVQLRPF